MSKCFSRNHVLLESNKSGIIKFTKDKNNTLVYLDMYAKSGHYSIFAPNDKVEQKFFKFLTLLRPILEEIDKAGDAYVLLLPYSYTVVYNSNTGKYDYSVEYAIISDTKAIEQKQIDKKSIARGVKFQYDTRTEFTTDISDALNAKPNKKKKYILVTNYPLYEQLRQAFAPEIANNELEVKSVYTVGLYHYIREMVNKDSINQTVSIDALCGNPSANAKTFSRSKIKDSDNLLIANRSSLSMAGLDRDSAQAVLTLPEELMEGLTMFYGFQLNAPNVICKGTKHLATKLLSGTSMYSNMTPDNDGVRYYAASAKASSQETIPERVKTYVKIVWEVAKIVFINTPNEMEMFLNLVNRKIFYEITPIVDNIKSLLSHKIKDIEYEDYMDLLIETYKSKFIEIVNCVQALIYNDFNTGLAQIHCNYMLLAANISNNCSIKDYDTEAVPLAMLVHIYVRLIRYRDRNGLIPKDDWKNLINAFEHIITKKLGFNLEPPPPQQSPQSGSDPNNTTTSPTSTSPTSSPPANPFVNPSNTSSIASPSGNPPNVEPNQKPLNNSIYILSSNRFIDCDLFDAKNAANYCKILLPQDRHNDIPKDPLGTIIVIADYICNFSGGMFSNVDQIYKLDEGSVSDVPVSFEKYYLKNLMIHTCDQREDAIQLLYRQARVDVKAVANNIALDIINDQFKPNNKNEYFLNIIVFKSKYVKVDFTALHNLIKVFPDSVLRRVGAMSFVLDDKDREQILEDTKKNYNFICSIHEVNDDDHPDLEKVLRNYNQHYCQNIVYMLDDHQYLHEMHLPLDEIQEYTISKSFQLIPIKVPLTGYAHYVIAYALNYANTKNQATLDYKKRTKFRVLMNSKSFSHDYARLLAYLYLLFNIQEFDFEYEYKITKSKVKLKIDVKKELEEIANMASNIRTINFSNKPYTVSLKAIQQFIDRVKSQTWYSYGFSRCNPERKKLFEEYYEISNQVYEGFMKSIHYGNYADQIISACQVHDSNAMDDNIGRVYLSILKPQEFSAINNAISQSTQNNPAYNIYFEKIRKYVEHVVTDINKLYNKFSKKLNGYDKPDIDYNIETKLLNTAFKGKGKMDTKAKLRFLDDLELDYVERIAYIMSAYMLKQLRASFKPYADWEAVLEAVFGADKLKTLLAGQLEGLSEETYEKVDKLSKSLGLSNTEKVILILNYLYLNRLYTEQNQDIEETFRVLIDDLLVTNVSEVSIYRKQTLIVGIRMFLQNFICDLYSKSKGNEFMDANRFSGNYLIICEDSDIAAALASSLSILLHFRSKTDKAMREIELVARQFYSNLFKTLYKRNNKWYKRIKDKIIGTSKNEYYDEELQFMDLTINAMNHALSTSENFINGNDFNSDYPLYGLSALVFILSIPLTVSLAMSVGDKDSTYSMIGMAYKYQDAMSAHGITLINSYCEAGYEQPELELPEDTELSHITDFPVSTNLISKENLFDKDNYNDAITTISEMLTHRAKTMDQGYGQVIVTDDFTRVGVDMRNVNTIIILAGRRNTFSQSERQGALILDKQVADSLYEQTGRKANVYYVTFEYDSRIDDMTQDGYLKPRFDMDIQNLYSVMDQVSQIKSATGKSKKGGQTSQSVPTVLTIAII